MAASDVSFTQNGGHGNVKLHPYLTTLVRWCVSCLWSTASVLLHRLLTAPLLPITAPKPPPRVSRPRQATSEHLHPEPRVECVVLYQPQQPTEHTLDVIFIHGLYGSLGNTWRQGEWKSKYKVEPAKVPLRNHSQRPCKCSDQHADSTPDIYAYETNINETTLNETNTFNQINGCFKNILPNDNSLITEQFYNNTFMNTNNYETQAKFVSEMFRNSDKQNTDNSKDSNANCTLNLNETPCNLNECKCKLNVMKKCEVGCGCVCDDCYSPCWPRDWIKEDFPGARVISVNYTSDPYLWRPLWVKGNKRLRLHERAEQMMSQLIELGVGQRPIVWVGHSKGGLFIKQIYCDAYEAHLKIKKQSSNNRNTIVNKQNATEIQNNNVIYNNFNEKYNKKEMGNHDFSKTLYGLTNNDETMRSIDQMSEIRNSTNSGDCFKQNGGDTCDLENNCDERECGCADTDVMLNNDSVSVDKQNNLEDNAERDIADMSSSQDEDSGECERRAAVWRRSSGFMFYSVPHRGSPLADIKTPITSRSVELLEIAKDCELVRRLQARWQEAFGAAGVDGADGVSGARVCSLVETRRTLMSVLWLRIVSVDSADCGEGALLGVALDHREVCKPSSRRCALYTHLTALIHCAHTH